MSHKHIRLRSTKPKRICRKAAAAVEFALVAPIFFLLVLLCFELGKAHMIEAFVEESSYRAARHVAVFGARTSEAETIALQNMSILGVEDVQVTVEPMVEGVVQPEIDSESESVRVVVSVPMNTNSIFSWFFDNNARIEKETVLMTERLNNI